MKQKFDIYFFYQFTGSRISNYFYIEIKPYLQGFIENFCIKYKKREIIQIDTELC